jgi:hypothetical protein
MLPNASAQRFAIELKGGVDLGKQARDDLNGAAMALGAALPTLALGEAAAALAAVVG